MIYTVVKVPFTLGRGYLQLHIAADMKLFTNTPHIYVKNNYNFYNTVSIMIN